MSYKYHDPYRVLQRLHTFAKYDAEKGQFIRTATRSGNLQNQTIGAPIGSPMNGYLTVYLFGVHFRLHNLVWAEEYGWWPDGQIDHIDGDRSNNKISNLRDVTQTLNSRNRAANRNSSTGFTGVSFHKRSGKYYAYIRLRYKLVHLGYFFSAEAASNARAAYIAKHPELGFTERHGEVLK